MHSVHEENNKATNDGNENELKVIIDDYIQKKATMDATLNHHFMKMLNKRYDKIPVECLKADESIVENIYDQILAKLETQYSEGSSKEAFNEYIKPQLN